MKIPEYVEKQARVEFGPAYFYGERGHLALRDINFGYSLGIEDAEEIVERLEEALKFYSNNGSHVIIADTLQPDNGRISTNALSALAEWREKRGGK